MSTTAAILSAAAVLSLVQIEAGNRAFRRGGVDEAVAAYRRAVERNPDDAAARYNLGTALLEAGEAGTALPHLERATEATPPELRARAFYNLGTAHLGRASGGDRESALRAVDALRRALLLEPDDADAKWNLELALRRLEEPPSPESPQGGPSGESGGADAPPDASGAGSGPGSEPSGAGAPSPETGPRAPRPQDLQPLPRATAEQILNAIEEQERALQREKLRQRRPAGRPVGPDW